MASVEQSIDVDAPAQACYRWWRSPTNLPLVVPDVESVEPLDGDLTRTRWTVRGPLGRPVSWVAELVGDEPESALHWRTDENAGGSVRTEGFVRFEPQENSTRVYVSFTYAPPGGVIAEAVAETVGGVDDKVRRGLAAFKTAVEAAAPRDPVTLDLDSQQ